MTGAIAIAAARGPRVARLRRTFRPMWFTSFHEMLEFVEDLQHSFSEARREREELLRRMN